EVADVADAHLFAVHAHDRQARLLGDPGALVRRAPRQHVGGDANSAGCQHAEEDSEKVRSSHPCWFRWCLQFGALGGGSRRAASMHDALAGVYPSSVAAAASTSAPIHTTSRLIQARRRKPSPRMW